MKLYTEEQVRKAIKLSLINAKLFIHKWLGKDDKYFPTVDEGINTITPIELPSDEEIENDAKEFVKSHDFSLLTNPNHLANRCFQEGAKWIKEQILNQNKQ